MGAIVTIDEVTNDVTVSDTSTKVVDVIAGGGNPSRFNAVVDHLNFSGLTGTRTLPNGFTLNQLAEWVIQVVSDLYLTGIFSPVTPSTYIVSSNRVYT